MLVARKLIEPDDDTKDTVASSVFSLDRVIEAPPLSLPPEIKPNTRLKMDGIELLSALPETAIPVVFFDPQYRGVLDRMNYGNEGKNRGRKRCELTQMTEAKIAEFVRNINRVLIPSGHLFLWVDKFHLLQGFQKWFDGTGLNIVDLITWDKRRMGMGYRSRRSSEYCVVVQKQPRRAKGVWKIRNILDVWPEKLRNKSHTHQKPLDLQSELIAAVSNEGDYIVDPAAGSFSVMAAAHVQKRNFIGCDLEG